MSTAEDPAGRYRHLAHLGQGGFGTVSRALDRALRREVALKQVLEPTPWHRDQLLHEARLLAWLDHPGVVQVYDTCGGEAGHQVTMAVLEGSTLARHLVELRERGQAVPLSEALRILRRISETLANAHDKGVLHLDIKPANIMVLPYGRVVLVDWGAARFFDRAPYLAWLEERGETEALELPHRQELAGTPAWMAPEQALGDAASLGPWTDVFAAGVVLYEILTGRLPLEVPGNAVAWAAARLRERSVPVAELRADVPSALGDLVAQMLQPRPEDRPRSFQAVIAELDALTGAQDAWPPRKLAAGEVLFEAGQRGDVAWQIQSGRLEVFIPGPEGPRFLASRGVGEMVGEVSLLTGEPRSAGVRAAVDSVVRPVSREGIEAELSKVSPLVAGMVRHLSLRLRESVQQVATAPVEDVGADAPGPGGVRKLLGRLRRVDPEQAELAEAILLGGLELEGAAALVGMELQRARREWAMARALVRRGLAAGEEA